MVWKKLLKLLTRTKHPNVLTIEIPPRTANDLAEMISSQFTYSKTENVTVGKSFALGLYHELKEWLAQEGGCDHAVNICYCSDQRAVHQLGVILRQEYPTCIFCERPLPSFNMTIHPECEEPHHAGMETD